MSAVFELIDRIGYRLLWPAVILLVICMDHRTAFASVPLVVISVLIVRFVFVTVNNGAKFNRR